MKRAIVELSAKEIGWLIEGDTVRLTVDALQQLLVERISISSDLRQQVRQADRRIVRIGSFAADARIFRNRVPE